MLLLELAAQGVRGVAPQGGRATLRPGYNVLASDGVALRRVIEALLWPDAVGGETVPRASGGSGPVVGRIGVTLLGNDNVTYRLVRDLAAGCQLHRFDPERRSFALVSQDSSGIGRYLASPCGFPPRGRFDSLLSISASDLPSKQAAGGIRGSSSASMPALRRSLTPEERNKRVAQLKAELEKAQTTEKQQYQLDGLQSKLFKLEEVLQSGNKIREGMAAAEEALRELATVAAVAEQLGDTEARLSAYEKAKEKLDEGMGKLEAERSSLGEESAPVPAPFWLEPRFLSAVAAGLVFMVLAFVGGKAGETAFRYLALLDLPAFAYAGYLAWSWVDQVEVREREHRRRKRFQEWEQKLQEQYQRDTSQVRTAIATLKLSSLGELKEALGRLSDAQAAAAEWSQRLADWEAKPETRDAATEKEKIDGAIREAESALASEAGGYVRDPRSIEMEISALMAEQTTPAAAPAAVTAPVASKGDTLKALVESGATALQVTPPAMLRQVSRKVAEVLPAFSAQRFAGLFTDERGNVLVQGGGRTAPVATLQPVDKDLCFLALKLGLMDLILASGKGLAFVDDAFAGLPEGTRRTAARVLKQMARAGQILHVTADPVFREAADHAG